MIFRCFLLVMLSLSALPIRAQPDTLSGAQGWQVRGGLPNVWHKLQAGQPVTLAYFGGSITEAGSGWREQSVQALQQRFPAARIAAINAAIGGTGSDLGVFRLRQQVLVHRPDLVFVEFAVNDGSQKPDIIHKAMEGIVRQIWQQNPNTDICFVYTFNEPMVPTLLTGQFPASVRAMEQIARHYGIPSVHLGLGLIAEARQGKVVWKGKKEDFPGKIVFSPDGTHPYSDTGHRFYTDALTHFFDQLPAKPKPDRHKLKTPFDADNWEQAQMLSVQDIGKSSGWQTLTPETDTVARQLRHRFGSLLKSSQPGASLTVRFSGKVLGLYDVIGPGCGQYDVQVDGVKSKSVPRFDSYATYYRSHYFFVPLETNGVHTVTLSVSADTLDKAAILKTRNNTINHPAAYQDKACYAGHVLLVGKLLDE